MLRLTKNRLQALHVALSLDDILFEKFRRLNEDLQRREAAFARRKNVARIMRRQGKIRIVCQIISKYETPDGTVLEVI